MILISPREYTAKYTLPDEERQRLEFLRHLFAPYRFSVLMGLPCTGKTTVMEEVSSHDRHLTRWSRAPIMEMILGPVRDERYNAAIARLESELLPSLCQREHHQVIVDGYNRTRRGRAHYLSCFPKGLGRSAIIVMDGPVESIARRYIGQTKYSAHPDEAVSHLAEMQQATVWPTMSEGWDDIIYLNSFGEEGYRHINRYVTRKVIST